MVLGVWRFFCFDGTTFCVSVWIEPQHICTVNDKFCWFKVRISKVFEYRKLFRNLHIIDSMV